MNEQWRKVPGLPLLASSLGRIVKQPSYVPLKNGGYRLYMPKPTFGQKRTARNGAKHVYRGVIFREIGNVKVHQAVCAAFHGEKPFDSAVVIHLDEDAENNTPDNLRWGTQKENLSAPRFREYCKQRTGENSPWAKWRANNLSDGSATK